MNKSYLDLLIMLFKKLITLFKSGAAEMHISNGTASFKVDLSRLAAHA